jgi:hypothetical protein
MRQRRSRALRHCRRWLAPVVFALACHDALTPGTRLPRPARNEVLVRLVVSPADSVDTYIVRAVATHGGILEAPAAYQASLQLPAGVAFVDDASRGSAFLLAMNVVDGALRVAGAAAQGESSDELFAVRVRSADPALRSRLLLQVIELRDRAGRDQRPTLRVLAPYREVAP